MDLVGKVLAGRYEIIEEIGKGGMANVYKAHCNLLKRNVAIKALRDDLENDKEFVRRFNIEAQAAASLSNPHIVSIYDVGCENGQYYIVMEYIEGKTLKEYIDEVGVIPWKEAIGYALQICDALEEAHKNSVVHRDIKPQNIIMTPDGVLKVTDFGIARATSQATMTMGKNTIGTAHYLSPEQARGGYTDGRSDIYSLGIVLYEMITGRLPFNDESPVTIAIKHLQEQMIPPTEVNPDIPKGLETVVLKATEKEQNSRYSTVTEMAADLNAVLKNPNAAVQSVAAAVLGGGDETIKIPAIGDQDVRDYENSKGKSGAIQYTSEAEDDLKKAEEIREKRERREQKKKDRRVTIAAIIAAILVIGGLGTAFMYMTGGFGIFGGVDESVEIPQVVGMNLQKAQAKYKGQYSIVEYDKVDSTKEAGTIVEQDPAAGEKRQKRDDIVIRVTVSSGKSSLTLNDYTNIDVSEAKTQLEQAGLKANIIEKYSDSTPANKVLSQEPKAGSSVGAGDLITLYVSKGSESDAPSNTKDTNSGEGSKATAKPEVTKAPEAEPTKAPPTNATEKPSTPTKKPVGGNSGDDENEGGSTSGGSTGGNTGGNAGTSGGSGGSDTPSGGGTSGGGNAGTSGGGNDGGATDVED